MRKRKFNSALLVLGLLMIALATVMFLMPLASPLLIRGVWRVTSFVGAIPVGVIGVRLVDKSIDF